MTINAEPAGRFVCARSSLLAIAPRRANIEAIEF